MKRFFTLAVALVASTCLYAETIITEERAEELGYGCDFLNISFMDCVDYFNEQGFDVVYGFVIGDPDYGYDLYSGELYIDGEYKGSINTILDEERLAHIKEEGEDYIKESACDYVEIYYINSNDPQAELMKLTLAESFSE